MKYRVDNATMVIEFEQSDVDAMLRLCADKGWSVENMPLPGTTIEIPDRPVLGRPSPPPPGPRLPNPGARDESGRPPPTPPPRLPGREHQRKERGVQHA